MSVRLCFLPVLYCICINLSSCTPPETRCPLSIFPSNCITPLHNLCILRSARRAFSAFSDFDPSTVGVLRCRCSLGRRYGSRFMRNMDGVSNPRSHSGYPANVSQQEGINCMMDSVWHGVDRVSLE
ncbi:uncharacterized protein F5891DRAFT_170257 [Suillus fuscotomentosus]|uniref:Secreted protein n=1 Tax=Suillus fuscotomentosus TaxID=1912939 RepID=A0AAD4DPR5_9AGAM|nr:uncharacterized protein F5891DRAFT_170257 [Suillus fuscotomentosus]KAG1888908.1 hypothetical protein F5891DRAFT_170257 [Suillus fuscotomentosus]